MKHKTSVAFDEETILGILELLRSGTFRNKSHVVEYAVQQLLKKSSEKNEARWK